MASEAFETIRRILAATPLPLDVRGLRDALEATARPLIPGVRGERVDAGGVTCELQTPEGVSGARLVLYLHGGGYVAGSIASHRNLTSHLARASGCRVLSVDYRRAPEAPHPAPVEDACTAFRWLIGRGHDPARVAIAGDSAGGGLALATQLRLRDAGDPLPAASVLISPWVDLAGTGETMRTHVARDPIVTPAAIAWLAGVFLGTEGRVTDPLASPLAGDLRGLPPMLIHVGEDEVLLADSQRLAAKAAAAGVDVTLEAWPEMVHVWHAMAGLFEEADAAIRRVGEYLETKLGR
jgi:acetyl esterase/lipase